MQVFIDFLVNNYLWFLIITLILIFALIGYLVDTSESANDNFEMGEVLDMDIPVRQPVMPGQSQMDNATVVNQTENNQLNVQQNIPQ